jgi:hypothetical protein
MQYMNNNDGLDKLKRIRRVEAPLFLLTRIQEKIRSAIAEPVPASWKWSFAVAGILIITLNIIVMRSTSSTAPKADLQEVVNAFHLSDSNNLYNE